MKTRPVILAMGVSHRDVELAALWMRWVLFLCSQPKGDNSANVLLIVHTKQASVWAEKLIQSRLLFANPYHEFSVQIHQCPDEEESGYPKSASHLFLRTLETAERLYPGAAVLWCEPDTVPLKPTWFAEIAAAYTVCGKPFFGAKIGTKFPHLAGNSVYPHNWRKLAPSIANVLSAPDYRLWGPGKGQPWDVFCRAETTPQMADSALWFHVWKERDTRPTHLKDIPRHACIFHQDKTGALIREIAAARYPEFMATLNESRRFFAMNGHPSRLRAKGLKIPFSYTKWTPGGHRSAVCSDELEDGEASALAALIGQLGVREITESEFLTITGRSAKSLPEPKIRPVPKEETHSDPVSHPAVFVMLGRYGDICNVLPMLKAEADAGRRPTLVVSKDFADILDGVSYVDRIVWEGAYDQLPDALRWLKKSKGIPSPVVCQFHRHPFDKARLTSSYQTECWRLAGRLKDFAKRGPLVFDRRDSAREDKLVCQIPAQTWNFPVVLIALESVSSPFKEQAALWKVLREIKGATCIDLSDIKAERIYDLISVYEKSACLVSVDTVHLHLSRGCDIRTVAILNDGWRGSVPNSNVTAAFRYSQVTPEVVVKAVNDALTSPLISVRELAQIVEKGQQIYGTKIFHAVDVFGSDTRHKAAQASWPTAYAEGITPVHVSGYPRDAHSELGDPRRLPFLKDILWAAIPQDSAGAGDEIVMFTNSDIGLKAGTAATVLAHVSKHHAAAMRRTESSGHGHPGRDLFAFTIDWLHEYWDQIPDFVIGAPVFDLGLVAMIRKFHGLPALTLKNLSEDMPPADMPVGFALHLSHDPEWQVDNMDSVPSVRHNKKVFREWAKRHAPEIRFSPGGNLK